jgi:signal transduction histidine kinase
MNTPGSAGTHLTGFADLFGSAPVSFVLLAIDSAQARIAAANPAAAALLGDEGLVGRDLISLLDPTDLPADPAAMAGLVDGRLDVSGRRRVYRRPDGSIVVVDALGFVVGRNDTEALVLLALSEPTRTSWMLRRLRSDVEATSALSELRAALLAGVEGDELFSRICESTRVLLGADNAGVLRLDESGHVELLALLDQTKFHVGQRWAVVDDDYGRALQASRAVSFTVPAAAVARAGDPVDQPAQIAMAPLVAGERTLGSLMVRRDAAAFDEMDLSLLHAYARGVSEAMTVAESRAELQQLRVLETVARDLHDEVIQDLIAVRFGLAALTNERLDRAVRTRVEELLDEVDLATVQLRDVVRGLHGPSDVTGFRETVRSITRRRAERIGMGWAVDVDARAVEALDVGQRREVLAALNEGLSNALRHSDGTEVGIGLALERDRVVLTVTDDGVGLGELPRRQGRGMRNLLSRAAESGGGARFESPPGDGTRLVWWLPVAGSGGET